MNVKVFQSINLEDEIDMLHAQVASPELEEVGLVDKVDILKTESRKSMHDIANVNLTNTYLQASVTRLTKQVRK